MVIALDKNKKPLGTCTERRARILMEKGRACVHKYYPFTIIVKDRDVRKIENLPAYRIKIDPGAKHTGIAVVREDTGEFVFGMQIAHHAEQIVRNLETRRTARRNRRQRETRYRKPKWGNKTLGKGKKPQYDSHDRRMKGKQDSRTCALNCVHWTYTIERVLPMMVLSRAGKRKTAFSGA